MTIVCTLHKEMQWIALLHIQRPQGYSNSTAQPPALLLELTGLARHLRNCGRKKYDLVPYTSFPSLPCGVFHTLTTCCYSDFLFLVPVYPSSRPWFQPVALGSGAGRHGLFQGSFPTSAPQLPLQTVPVFHLHFSPFQWSRISVQVF